MYKTGSATPKAHLYKGGSEKKDTFKSARMYSVIMCSGAHVTAAVCT